MPRPRFDRERAARVIVDAIELGDLKASEKWGITDRTLRNYRARLADDPELSALVAKKGKAAEASWHTARASVLLVAAQRAIRIIENETNLDKISRLVEAFGEIDMAATVLNVRDEPDREDSTAPAPAGEPGEGTPAIPH